MDLGSKVWKHTPVRVGRGRRTLGSLRSTARARGARWGGPGRSQWGPHWHGLAPDVGSSGNCSELEARSPSCLTKGPRSPMKRGRCMEPYGRTGILLVELDLSFPEFTRQRLWHVIVVIDTHQLESCGFVLFRSLSVYTLRG
jgi:hypothetical protein